MKTRTSLALILLAAAAPGVAEEAKPAAAPKLPYVYTNWKQFTVADGLPNDHIFAVKVDGPRVWVGTEDGLALIDKPSGKVVKTWREKDGLPFKVVTAIDVDKKTGDVWLGMFGGGLARLSGDRFDHWHQMNSGLVNDVVYGVAVENDNIWAATTAGASRLNTVTGEWTVFTEKNAPMEEIWNYSAAYDGKDTVYLGVWGSGMLEYDIKSGHWKEYLDPDREMEIDLYRDDGIIHVIVTGASPAEGVVWISTYFGGSRYDGRHWRGYTQQEDGLPSDFNNNIKGRSAQEALFCSDKGLGIITDAPNERRDLGRLHARSGDGPWPGQGDGRREGGRERRDAGRRAAQLHDRGRRRRQRHLGGHGEGARLGHRRRLLPGDEGAAALRVRAAGARADCCSGDGPRRPSRRSPPRPRTPRRPGGRPCDAR